MPSPRPFRRQRNGYILAEQEDSARVTSCCSPRSLEHLLFEGLCRMHIVLVEFCCVCVIEHIVSRQLAIWQLQRCHVQLSSDDPLHQFARPFF